LVAWVSVIPFARLLFALEKLSPLGGWIAILASFGEALPAAIANLSLGFPTRMPVSEACDTVALATIDHANVTLPEPPVELVAVMVALVAPTLLGTPETRPEVLIVRPRGRPLAE
jgi:hypothetical protein